MKLKENFNKIKNLWERYEIPIGMIGFLFGFTIDNFTLSRVDRLYNHLILSSYLLVAGISIIILRLHDAGYFDRPLLNKGIHLVPLFMQFAFGGLFSGFTVYYLRSSSLINSWPFIVLLLILLIGNEAFRKRYYRFVFQMTIFYIALLSYLVLLFPVLFKEIGISIFILSGVSSLILISGILFLLSLFTFKKVKENRKNIIISVLSVFLIFNIFYFTNIIPPVPLSLKEGGVYHSIDIIEEGGYEMKYEPSSSFYSFFEKESNTFHRKEGERVYFYSAIFAPFEMEVEIYHRWLYFNEKDNRWEEVNTLGFPIEGGREEGYRGYSYKENVKSGKWKVEVINKKGQVLGSDTFKVIETDKEISLKTIEV